MKERPIMFSGDEVRAVLDGRKTQTRRIIKPQPVEAKKAWFTFFRPDPANTHEFSFRDGNDLYESSEVARIRCPYGMAGDRLWVRETWRPFVRADWCDHVDDCACPPSGTPMYRADGIDEGKWKSAASMPRSASRILLEITGIRAERLQKISDMDAKAEGVIMRGNEGSTCYNGMWRSRYAGEWAYIYGQGSWCANPWVWVIEFRRVAA